MDIQMQHLEIWNRHGNGHQELYYYHDYHQEDYCHHPNDTNPYPDSHSNSYSNIDTNFKAEFFDDTSTTSSIVFYSQAIALFFSTSTATTIIIHPQTPTIFLLSTPATTIVFLSTQAIFVSHSRTAILHPRILNTRIQPISVSHLSTNNPSCGIAGYVKTTAAYYFESSGTKNTFAACSALCKADTKCKSFGYGEANCMLFDVAAVDNTNLNPSSPYTFYDATCPSEVPVGKRSPQLDISFGLPAGINISLDLGPKGISSACSCLITSGPASTTVTRTQSSAIVTTATVTSTTTRTIGAA
ncbi:hypothetical protein PTNB73_07434 [Pyrenophora teres f. teres]|nr:hypothetical protein PTNB85_09443 [Pyrenophora teres f. teres]KAE8835381.1 hypothetical protein HRS9122_07651 [Pyrenophora teres f. teres]KAE8858281.1 hypothetical protein PTNB29_07496 [Pyrenophora teres f. teres]KAE8861880.1 hypothetical protein PTNB73_07434 [Pyrenophora teres f. teres]